MLHRFNARPRWLLCLPPATCALPLPFSKPPLCFRSRRRTSRIPATLRAPNGDLLIIAEKRNDGPGDIGDHDIALKRSRDQGRTWGTEQVIFDDEKRVCTDLTVGLDAGAGKIWLFFLRDKKQFNYFTSLDSGETWQGPVSVHEQVTRPEWDKLSRPRKDGNLEKIEPRGRMAIWERGWNQRYGVGPGNGVVQLQSGPKAGRLIVPARHREDTGGGRLRSFSHCFWSDDGRRDLEAWRHARHAHERMPARRVS